jgi:hypothetical protein
MTPRAEGWMAVCSRPRHIADKGAEHHGRSGMMKPRTKIGSRIGSAALVAALLGLLGASLWYASRSWTSIDAPPMPAQGYVAMILGVVFSVALGGGLMALVFYSSRYGYDDEANRDQHLAGEDDHTFHRTQEPKLR